MVSSPEIGVSFFSRLTILPSPWKDGNCGRVLIVSTPPRLEDTDIPLELGLCAVSLAIAGKCRDRRGPSLAKSGLYHFWQSVCGCRHWGLMIISWYFNASIRSAMASGLFWWIDTGIASGSCTPIFSISRRFMLTDRRCAI